MRKHPSIYIMSNKPSGILYTGVTSTLQKRVWQHKNMLVDGFTKKYNLKILVYYEVHDSMEQAIKREKQLKNWKRKWKIELIETNNPKWKDLYANL